MGTRAYPCGCRISNSMFGAHELLDVIPCYKHALLFQTEMRVLAEAMDKLQAGECLNLKGE